MEALREETVAATTTSTMKNTRTTSVNGAEYQFGV